MRNRRTLVAVVAGIAMFALWYLLLWSPASKQLTSARAAHASAVQAEQSLVGERDALLAKTKTLPAVRLRAAALTSTLPATADLPGLIDQISSAATSSGVTLPSLSQSAGQAGSSSTAASSTSGSTSTASSGTTATSATSSAAGTSSSSAADGLQTVNVDLSVSGSYQQDMAFLDALQSLPRYVTISDSSVSGTSGALSVSVTASSYYDPSSLPKAPTLGASS